MIINALLFSSNSARTLTHFIFAMNVRNNRTTMVKWTINTVCLLVVQVETDGVISFGAKLPSHSHSVMSSTTPLVAPYWSNADTRKNNGRVYYRKDTGNTVNTVVLDRGWGLSLARREGSSGTSRRLGARHRSKNSLCYEESHFGASRYGATENAGL